MHARPPVLASIVALLASVAALIAGNSLLNVLAPLRASFEGFSPLAIGLLGSAYFCGMLVGTIITPRLMARVGLIRAFIACVAASIIAATIYPLAVHPVVWIALRAILGFALAGLYGVIDAWINAKASNANRGRLYAFYQVINYIASGLGQQVPQVADPHGFQAFSVAAILLALSIVPLAMTRSDAPAQPRVIRFSPRWLWRTAPVGVAVGVVTGAANGAFFALGPVYALKTGGTEAAVGRFLTAAVLGSALMVWPMGRLSDRVDRRLLIAASSVVGCAVEIVLLMRWAEGAALPLASFCVGASTMTLYTLGIAHANDCGRGDRVVEVATGLLFVYCAGAILSSMTGSALMAHFGAAALFGQNAALHGALALAALGLTAAGLSRPARQT